MLECFKGYRKHPNLCVEDSEISESARKIVERVEFYLCEEYAQFMCYETGSIWVSSVTLCKPLDCAVNLDLWFQRMNCGIVWSHLGMSPRTIRFIISRKRRQLS
ncbi:hypothetical protein S83_004577 [Arachis hypogaea]